MSKRLMPTTVLRAIADLIDAGMVEDVAVVATMTDQEHPGSMAFGIPPVNPDRLIKMLNEMTGWVGNKSASVAALHAHLASSTEP